MKRKRSRKMWCFLICMSLMVVFFSGVRAANSSDSQIETHSDGSGLRISQDLYVLEALRDYEDSFISDTHKDSYFVSQQYPIYNATEDCYVTFVFSDNKCIGSLTISFVEGEYYSSFHQGEDPLITACLKERTSFYLYYHEDWVYVYTGYGCFLWFDGGSSANKLIGKKTPLNFGEIISLNEIQVQKRVRADDMGPDIGGSFPTLNVPFVKNDRSPVSNKGLCWAASMASIIMYRKNLTGLTARSCYDSLKSPDRPDPIGTCDNISLLYAWNGLHYTHLHKGFSLYSAASILRSGRPIYCWLTTQTGKSHAVVICGVDHYNGKVRYVLMEPNGIAVNSGRTYVVVNDYNSLHFTYLAQGGTRYVQTVCHFY